MTAPAEATSAANCWHETMEAMALLERIDAYERSADRWYSDCPEASKAFTELAEEIEQELDDLRSEAVDRAADACAGDRSSDEWLDAWQAADIYAPPVRQVVQEARRRGAGDGYLEMCAA